VVALAATGATTLNGCPAWRPRRSRPATALPRRCSGPASAS